MSSSNCAVNASPATATPSLPAFDGKLQNMRCSRSQGPSSMAANGTPPSPSAPSTSKIARSAKVPTVPPSSGEVPANASQKTAGAVAALVAQATAAAVNNIKTAKVAAAAAAFA